MSLETRTTPSVVTPRGEPRLRLADGAVSAPAIASNVRPSLVLPERHSRALLTAAARLDIGSGGCLAAGPAGIQLWSGPFDGPGGSRGCAVHLGSVDWSYDTPTKHYVTIYRVMVTAAGLEAQESPATLLGRVLALIGEPLPHESELSAPTAPPRDPFRTGRF